MNDILCPWCGQHLQVSDDLAGMLVTCPQCNRVCQVGLALPTPPRHAAVPPASEPEMPAEYFQPTFDRPAEQHEKPASAPPSSKQIKGHSNALKATRALGIAIAIFGIINATVHVAQLVGGLTMSHDQVMEEVRSRPQLRQLGPAVVYAAILLMGIIALTLCGVQVAGGMAMHSRQGWGMAMAGCIVSLVPCLCWTWIVTCPTGIAGIVLLNLAPVRKRFR